MYPFTSTDQMGLTVRLEKPPRRIVSLVPSQTELLFDLGLENEVVGVTKFCVHPEDARKTRAVIGGTKKFDLEKIAALEPDLVIGNKEENSPEGIDFLRERFPVWMSDICTVEDALRMIESVSALVDRQVSGEKMVAEIKSGVQQMPKLPTLRTLYLMWYHPWMGAASETFIHDILLRMGLTNVLAGESRYPELTKERLQKLAPELVLLSSEPFPFNTKHQQLLEDALPEAKILQVDGEMFSWYGSRLKLVPAYASSLVDTLNPK